MSRPETLTVLYSCAECGLTNQAVVVPARLDGSSNVAVWMRNTGNMAHADHKMRSPACKTRTLDKLALPMPEGVRWVGDTLEEAP